MHGRRAAAPDRDGQSEAQRAHARVRLGTGSVLSVALKGRVPRTTRTALPVRWAAAVEAAAPPLFASMSCQHTTPHHIRPFGVGGWGRDLTYSLGAPSNAGSVTIPTHTARQPHLHPFTRYNTGDAAALRLACCTGTCGAIIARASFVQPRQVHEQVQALYPAAVPQNAASELCWPMQAGRAAASAPCRHAHVPG